jgi:hypothetical protein
MATLPIDLPETPQTQQAYRLAADSPHCGAPLVLRQNRLCQRGAWQDRLLIETVLAMLTLVSHFKKVMHRGWASFQARLAFTIAAFNVRVHLDPSRLAILVFRRLILVISRDAPPSDRGSSGSGVRFWCRGCRERQGR